MGELGAEVVLADIRAPGAGPAAERSGGQRWMALDLADEAQMRALIRTIMGDYGRLDVVVHSAALVGSSDLEGWGTEFGSQTVAAWDKAMRVNLTSAFVLAQATRKALAESGKGAIVLIASIYGLVGPDFRLYEGTDMHNPAAYGVSKAGLIHLTRYLATLLAPKIRVNALTPGGVWRDQPAAFVKRYEERTPMGRMATEEDLKGGLGYLATDLSAYVTGQNLVIDGGWTAW